GGLSRRVRRAAGARAAGAPPRRDGALRAPLDLARQRSRAVGRAAALVSGLLRRALDVGPEHDVLPARIALAWVRGAEAPVLEHDPATRALRLEGDLDLGPAGLADLPVQ